MKYLLLFALVAGSQAFLGDWFGGGSSAEWNGLRAGFGINPFTSFYGLPTTASDAIKDGWTLDATVGSCSMPSSYFKGNRYRKNGDQAIMLLYDKNGYIAGIQAGIPKTLSTYPAPNNAKYHVFNEESDMWVVTAYFTDPASICTTGRTKGQFEKEGLGNMLAFQTGTTSSNLLQVPHDEKDVEPTTKFVQGKCFYTMGMHYWYNISADLPCTETFPVFLLYNKKRLNGFGWAFNPDYKNSDKWEHPTKSQYPMFMKDPPTCLGKDGPVSTLHVYLTDSPRTNFC
ncbi:uncharacterized protein [Watersipora subatra]|uniref:uncharacterized protein n=1 Tax=Watersipora subatra TaxID=2589382 RepID=UPI00355B5930